MVQGSNITMEKIKELILNVNRILWNKKLENKVQDYLDNLLKLKDILSLATIAPSATFGDPSR